MVDALLLSLIQSLQRKTGYACVSERALRQMIFEDVEKAEGRGLLPGVSTVTKALRRLEEGSGEVEARWIHRGCPMPDGRIAQVGMMRLRVPVNRHERMHVRANAKRVNRREGTGARLLSVPTEALFAALNMAADRVDQTDRQRIEAGRKRNLVAAAEWIARNGIDGKGPPS